MDLEQTDRWTWSRKTDGPGADRQMDLEQKDIWTWSKQTDGQRDGETDLLGSETVEQRERGAD